MLTKESLIKDIKDLGIGYGDVLFVRLSYKAIGKVEGGPKAVIDALLEVLGDQGTLIATAFPSRQKEFLHRVREKKIYKPGIKPVTGIIPTLMCIRPDAFISSNPITPFVAIGGNAEKITANHTADTEPYSLIDNIIHNYNAKCLRVGGNVLVGTTHLAFTEALVSINAKQKRVGEGMYYYDKGKLVWKRKNISCFCYDSYSQFYNKFLKDTCVLSCGKMGEGEATVTNMLRTYEIEKEMLIGNPQILQCNDDNCLTCRCSYTYSDKSIMSFIFHQLRYRDEKSSDRIKDALQLLLLGRYCV